MFSQGFSKNEFNPSGLRPSGLSTKNISHSQFDLPSFGLDPDAPVIIIIDKIVIIMIIMIIINTLIRCSSSEAMVREVYLSMFIAATRGGINFLGRPLSGEMMLRIV